MMDWNECKINNWVKEVKAGQELIDSLKIQSNKKFQTAERIITDDISASTKFCDYYDSLRIILEAIALKKGFKIYNHDCLGGFLKEILKLEKEAEEFDKFRIIRNGINYYGQDLSPENANMLIQNLIQLKKEVEGFL